MNQAELLNNLVRPWITQALNDLEGTETVTWDASIMVLPDIDPDDENAVAFRPALVLYFSIPVDSERNAYMSPIVPPFGVTQELITQLVENSLEKLREQLTTE